MSCRQCIAHIRPGVRVGELHRFSCAMITDALVRMGLLGWARRSVDAHCRFYPHSLGGDLSTHPD